MEVKTTTLGAGAEIDKSPPTLGFFVSYGLAVISTYMLLMTPVTITLAIRISQIDPVGKGGALGTVLSVGAFFAMIANPVAGRLSDRTNSRFGRRRPWILGGFCVSTIALFTIAWTNNFYIILLSWCVAQIGGNGTLVALNAVVADRIPESHRGRVSSIIGMGASLGVLVGSFLVMLVGSTGMAMFTIPTVLGLIAIIIFVFVFREPATKVHYSQPLTIGYLLGSLWVNPFRYKDFGWAFVSRFLVFYGAATTLSYQVYLLLDRFNLSHDEIGKTMFVSSLLTAIFVTISASIGSWLSDKYQKRKIFVFAAALIYAGGIFILIANVSLLAFFIGTSVLSIGFGCYLAVDNALVVDVLPNRETDAAKNMGVMNIANTVPQSLAPAVAPLILLFGSANDANYVFLFCLAAVVAALGAVAILPVKGTT